MIKVIKTEVNQTIELKIPEGYMYDDSKKPDLNTFTGKLLVPIKRVLLFEPKEGE